MSQPRQHVALDAFFEWETQSWVEVVEDVTTNEKAHFMPLETLRAYFAADDCKKLDKILCEVFSSKYPPVDSEFILREHVAVFAILLRIGQGTYIEHFARYEELSDRRLPFDGTHPPVGFPTPDDDPTFLQRFCEKQRVYCVPIFDAHMLHKHFGNARLLPIISKEPRGDDGLSDKYVIKVYGPHNKMLPKGQDAANNPNANTFLLKRYPTKDGEPRYNQKISGFRSVRQADSIIKFYGSYIHRDNYNILLEFADKGSLEEYFQRQSPPSRGGDIIKFWEGLFQLIKGLKAIHSARDGHFDVKPENILLVSNGSESPDWLFKFADFGSSNAKGVMPSDRLLKANEMKDTPTYEAPECYMPYTSDDNSAGSSNKITWPADIWSLGCIYSEAAMWIADGYKGLTDYRKQRMADTDRILFKGGDCFHDGERVLPSVIEAHKEIEDRLRRSDYITQDVLDSMVEEMLWEEDRPNAKALWRKAEGVLSRARQRMGANSGDEMSRNSSGHRSLPPLRSQPPTKPLPTPPSRPTPPGLSSIAEQVNNVEKWRSQVTTSVVSNSQPPRPPSDISSPALTHAQLSSAATVTTDLDREIDGSLASWQVLDDNASQATPITPFTSPHASTYEPSVNEAPLVRHRILRPHPQFEYRRPPQAMSHLSNPRNSEYDNAYLFNPPLEPQPPIPPTPPLPLSIQPQATTQNSVPTSRFTSLSTLPSQTQFRTSARNSILDDRFTLTSTPPPPVPQPSPLQTNSFMPMSKPPTPVQQNIFMPMQKPPTPVQQNIPPLPSDVLSNRSISQRSPPPEAPRKTETARIFSQEITTTFRTQGDWDLGNAIVDPRTAINEKRTSLGRVPSQAPSQSASRAPSRAGSQHSSSVYSGATPSIQPDNVSFTTMIAEEPKLTSKPSKRGFGFSLFPTKHRNESNHSLESHPSTRHENGPPPYSSSDTASTVSWLPEHGPTIEYLSLNTCLEWKRANKNTKNNKKQKLPPLPGANRLKGLSDRDHVFIIDDSASMATHWEDVKRLFEALSYTVKGMSPDGTELYFTVSYDTWRRKDTFDLCQYLEKKTTSLKATTDISKRLNLQLETYRARYLQEKTAQEKGIDRKKREKIAGVAPRTVRPMSFYILTNGEWKPNSDPKRILQEQASWLIAQKLPKGQTTVEFISFANSGPAMQRLSDLARWDFGVDIVDCERWTGNVLKMLSGPLDKAFWSSQEGGEVMGSAPDGLQPLEEVVSGVSEMAA